MCLIYDKRYRLHYTAKTERKTTGIVYMKMMRLHFVLVSEARERGENWFQQNKKF